MQWLCKKNAPLSHERQTCYLKNYPALKLCCFNHQRAKWNARYDTQAFVYCIKKGKPLYLKREKIALYDFTNNDFIY